MRRDRFRDRLFALGMASSIVGLALGLAGCPTPPMPKGPAPEYEDPPPPSWLSGRDGGEGNDGSTGTEAGPER